MKKTTNKALVEQLNTCKTLLAEKRLRESSFADLLKPSMDLLDQVHAAMESGDLDLPPVDEDSLDISKILDTSEKDLDPTDGTLTEAAIEKRRKLLEDRSYNALLTAYIEEGGTENFEDWRTWAQQQPEALKALTLNKGSFQRHYRNQAQAIQLATASGAYTPSSNAAPVADTAAAAAPVVDPNYVMSDNLKNLLAVAHANEDFVETAATTVADKYETIELLLRRVIRGKSSKRYYILAGDAGIGKTYTVAKLLEEEGKKNIDDITYTGSIGRSPTAIAQFLWEHRNDEILVLDDCDSFLRKGGNPDVINILKGCMEPGTHYRVGIPTNIAARVTKVLQQAAKDESTVSDKVRSLLEGEEMSDTDIEDEEIDLEGVDLEADDAVPTSWTWNARMVIISNLHESQIDDALWSRCDHFDLHLTQEEYLVRLAMIIDKMDVGQNAGICTEEEAKEAKALVLSVMQGVIEAGNHGVQFYGKYIRLTDHLEFRIVKDLVNTWLAMLERDQEKNPGKDIEQSKKDIMERWVRIGVVPRMSASKVL